MIMGEWKFRPLHFRKSCGRILIQVNKDMTGVGGRRYPPGPVKREAGARPARSRRCERRVMLHAAFWQRMSLGRKFISCEERKGAAKAPDKWGEEPDSREGEAGGDAQVRRPACDVCHEATRNWLALNARGKRVFDSAFCLHKSFMTT